MKELDEHQKSLIETAMLRAKDVWGHGMNGEPSRQTLGNRSVPRFSICQFYDLRDLKNQFDAAVLEEQRKWLESHRKKSKSDIAKEYDMYGIKINVGIPILDEHEVHAQFFSTYTRKGVEYANVFKEGTWFVSIGKCWNVGNYWVARQNNDFVLKNTDEKFQLHHFIYPDFKNLDDEPKGTCRDEYLRRVKEAIDESVRDGCAPSDVYSTRECGELCVTFFMEKQYDNRLSLWS